MGDISKEDVDLLGLCEGGLHAVFEQPVDELAAPAAWVVALVFHCVRERY